MQGFLIGCAQVVLFTCMNGPEMYCTWTLYVGHVGLLEHFV